MKTDSALSQYKLFELISKHRSELMGIATIWVFLLHKWEPIFGNVNYISTLEDFVVKTGACGVDIFMFVSGLGLVFSYEKSTSIKEFYYKRIKRIFIPYFIRAVVLYGISINLIKDVSGYNFWFISLWGTSAWFYHAILCLYLLFPLYYLLLKKTNKSVLITIIVILSMYGLSFFGDTLIRGDMYHFINRIPFFVSGVALAYNARNGKDLKYSIPLVLFTLVILFNVERINLGLYYYETLNVLLSLCVIILLPLVLEKIGNKYLFAFLSFIGALSYEMHLMQVSIDPGRFYNNFPVLVANILLFIATVVVSYILKKVNDYFWIFFEKLIINRNKE